jgi:PAS domain S-box-containing protein
MQTSNSAGDSLAGLSPSIACRMIMDSSGNFRFTHLSPEFARAHGVTPEQVYADAMLLCNQLERDDFARLVKAAAESLKTGMPVKVDLRFRTPSGELNWALLYCVPKRIEDGSTVWDGVEIDITERRGAEEALKESEEKYRLLVEASPHAMFLRDKNDRISYINPAGLKIFGAVSPDQVVGRFSLEFVHPDFHSIVNKRICRVLEDGETTPLMEQQFIRLDGSVVEVEVTSIPFSQEGEPGLQVLFRDITRRKQSEKSLQSSQAFLDAIIEHSPHSMWVSDSAGTMIRMNQACRDMFLTEDDEVVGKYNLLKDNVIEKQGHMPLVKKVFELGEKVQFTLEYDTSLLQVARPKIPTSLTLEVTISPVLDAQNNVIHAVIQHVDITERRRFEAALKRRQELGHLITIISSRFLKLEPEEINDGISNSLREIGEFMEAERSFLFFLHDDRQTASVTHEWCADAVESNWDLLQDLNVEEYAFFTGPLLRSEIVHYPRLPDVSLPIHLGKVAKILERSKSLLLVPIEFGRIVVGCLGFDAVNQEMSWPDDVIGLLRVVGEVFTSALARKRAEEDHRKSEQFLSQVIENAPFGAHFYRIDGDDKLIFTKANMAAGRILHLDHAPLIGKTIEEAFPGLKGTDLPITYEKIARYGIDHFSREVEYNESGIRGAFEINAFPTLPGHMAVFFVDITGRKSMEEALIEEATLRRILFEQSPDGIVILDPVTTRFMDFNTAAHRQLGYTREEFSHLSIQDVDAVESSEEIRARIAQVLRGGGTDFETRQRTKQGEFRNVHVRAHTVEALGKSFYQCIWRDITDRKRAEEERKQLQIQLAQAQKMESVGRLAGGVAHDFNNMLSVIIGHAEMALDQFSTEDPMRADIEEIRIAAQRSADLTRQLLAFARKQAITPKVLNLNDAISGMLTMLRRLIGEDIELSWMPQTHLHSVRIDPTQLDQALANLCVNARDAIAGIGRIKIRTQNTTVTEQNHPHDLDIKAGKYVLLSVADNGCGMSREVQDHLFEPFFTTKEVGRGTGLGLATVYGVVTQNQGVIYVKSELGKGTEIEIYLPSVELENSPTVAAETRKSWRGFGETVLIVEDEPAILNLGKTMLKKMGLNVLAANGPGDAIRMAEDHAGTIELLISDVIMPEMNGRDLASRIAVIYPNIKCLFMSGYTADVIANRGVLNEGVNFIQKPFSLQDLSAKVRELLKQR